MNTAVRSRPDRLQGTAATLAEELPPLVRRLRVDALQTLVARLPADFLARAPLEQSGALGDCLRALEAERTQLRAHRAEFIAQAAAATEASALRLVLETELRRTRSGRALRGDLRALRRWLDADALVERQDAAIDAIAVQQRLLLYWFDRRPMRGWADDILVQSEHADRATRRLVVGVVARWAADCLREGVDRDGADALPSPTLVARLTDLALGGEAEPLVARRALALVAELPRGVELLADRVANVRSDPRDILVRAEAARWVVRLDGAEATWIEELQTDPSEMVRGAVVTALVERGDPLSIELAATLASDDPAASVRSCLSAATPPEPLQDGALAVGDLEDGARRSVNLPAGATALDLARQLLPLAADGRGFSLQPRGGQIVVQRGARRVARLWRLLDSLRHPDPGRRPGGDHLSGLHWRGNIRVPSRRMAEVSPTGVPGRAVLAEGWSGWAPWLPLLDDLVDCLARGPLTLVTEEGLTELQPPATLAGRVRARAALAADPRGLDRLRRASLAAADRSGRGQYIERLQRLGFRVRFVAHGPTPVALSDVVGEVAPPLLDPVSAQGVFAVPLLAELWAQVYSSSDSSELLVVSLGIAGLFGIRLVRSNLAMRRARAHIPLVIGGWGTRGKSGVERLKAALFEGLGVEVTCKTTGCEAMLVHTPPGRPAVELFLYRPYDRASIWEHAATLRTAAAFNSPVFLWECMALKPHYVQILQRHWTKDDVSTITNTYPDHEDVHGPTGEDVATVISEFIPDRALVLTAETQMTSVLRERAVERRTELLAVDEQAVRCLPADLVALFPHQEHPANIALVAELAQQLDIPAEEAIALMSEYVLPDLGSLATFPPVRHRGRVLQYSNGSSANERTGFINNWKRCGFENPSLEDVGTWQVTIVNNRYDRVARSQVFAEILVRDATAHRHVLIGTNLEGLRGYLAEALDGWLGDLDLLGGGLEALEARWRALTEHLLVLDPGALVRSCAARLGVEDVGRHVASQVDGFMGSVPARIMGLDDARASLGALLPAFEQLAAAASEQDGVAPTLVRGVRPGTDTLFADGQDRALGLGDLVPSLIEVTASAVAWKAAGGAILAHGSAVESAVHGLVRELFFQKIVVVEDSGASGDAVIDAVARSCPPGVITRCMSVQNIKGTGLDFVYRWVYGRTALEEAAALDAAGARRRQALDRLAAHREWSVPAAREALAALRTVPQTADVRALVEQIGDELAQREDKLAHGPETTSDGIGKAVRRVLHMLWDPLDAILRRYDADRLFADLSAGRISHARAAVELRLLTERGKGPK